MAITATTKLQAVNIALNNVGQNSVASLDVAVPVDAAIASSVVDEVSREVQMMGFDWNTESITISPDGSGFINLPANILKADVTGENYADDYIQRGLKMYNRPNNSFVFTKAIEVYLTLGLEFTEISEAARRYITIRAARLFQERMFGSVEISQFNADDEAIARAALAHEETENGDYNMVQQNWSSYEILGR